MNRIALAALVSIAVSTPRASAGDLIDVRIDQRFELMSIVFRLAEFDEYRMGGIADYNGAVDAWFAPFKDHETVKMARALRESIGFDAIPILAVRAVDARRFRPLRPLADPALGLDERWSPEVAQSFLKAMARFAEDTRASRFFAARAALYRGSVDACRSGLVGRIDQAWYARTFGKRDRDTFTVVVALLNGPANYGVKAPNARGGEDIYAFVGAGEAAVGTLPAFSESYLPTLVHEFLHSFSNTWVERHLGELQTAGDALNAPVAKELEKQAYGDGHTALVESMVRALTIRYFREHGDEKAARRSADEDVRMGFYWVERLSELLGEYTADRKRYPDLESFTPKLVAAFRTLGEEAPARYAAWQDTLRAERERREAQFEKGPKLVSTTPPDGGSEVEPVAVIRLAFDRPMSKSMSILRAEGEFPESAGSPEWDAEGKVLTWPVRLKPGTAYRFALNSDLVLAFKDRDGLPLRPTVVGFTTR